jgi:hypothetical protein
VHFHEPDPTPVFDGNLSEVIDGDQCKPGDKCVVVFPRIVNSDEQTLAKAFVLPANYDDE